MSYKIEIHERNRTRDLEMILDAHSKKITVLKQAIHELPGPAEVYFLKGGFTI